MLNKLVNVFSCYEKVLQKSSYRMAAQRCKGGYYVLFQDGNHVLLYKVHDATGIVGYITHNPKAYFAVFQVSARGWQPVEQVLSISTIHSIQENRK